MYFIYEIKNTKNARIYIGFTCDIIKRKANHFTCLKCNKHKNKLMQHDYNEGCEFTFRELKRFEDKLDALECERNTIKETKSYYNRARGRKNITPPQRTTREIVEQILYT